MSLTRGGWFIWLSLLLASLLSIVIVPDNPSWSRPDWVLVVLIYWVLALDNRAVLGIAWVMGIVLDLLHNSLFGEQALGLVVIAYFIVKLRQKMRVYPLAQQLLIIFLASIAYHLISLSVQHLIGAPLLFDWLAVFMNVLLWPLIFISLRYCRRCLQIEA